MTEAPTLPSASGSPTDMPHLDTWARDEAIRLLASKYRFSTILDVGAGSGVHTQWLRAVGKRVTSICYSASYGFEPDIVADFMETTFPEPFDAVWASHVLEHQLDVGAFLRKLWHCLKPGGILAITVPPMKPQIVGGHVSVWNAGLLLYNLILAGFDCSEARVHSYGYNVSVIVRRRLAALPGSLTRDAGDIEKLAGFFPLPVSQDFDGTLYDVHWHDAEVDLRPVPGPAIGVQELQIEDFFALECPFETDLDALLWAFSLRSGHGHCAEFGVFQGRSITALAGKAPEAVIWGFDSFEGLPEAWVRSETSTYHAGHFALDALPVVPPHVQLVKGFFDVSLEPWLDRNPGPMAVIHIDADLYSSTRYVCSP